METRSSVKQKPVWSYRNNWVLLGFSCAGVLCVNRGSAGCCVKMPQPWPWLKRVSQCAAK